MRTFAITAPLRIATAGGEAVFSDVTGARFANEFGRGWLTLDEGDEVRLHAAFPDTHTFMVSIVTEVEGEDDEPVVLERGAVLRLASFEKLAPFEV